MTSKITRIANWLRRKRDLKLRSEERIDKWGHRRYVGGGDPEAWYGIGKRQYHFLVSEGLQPSHTLLDIACGSLRLGQYVIPMLDSGRYYGIDAEEELVQAGLDRELLFDVAEVKRPAFEFNSVFDFSFCDGFDFAIAQSLFTHLTLEDIRMCFENLAPISDSAGAFYATFFEGEESRNPPGESHANRDWYYQFRTLRRVAELAGWELEYLGDWGHERDQKMLRGTIAAG